MYLKYQTTGFIKIMNEIRTRKPGTPVYVSNGCTGYYGFFNSLERTESGIKVTIDAGVPVRVRSDVGLMNHMRFILMSHTIYKVETLETLNAADIKKFHAALIEASQLSDKATR